jgi:uncharacterized membrane protein (UPF0127 family)
MLKNMKLLAGKQTLIISIFVVLALVVLFFFKPVPQQQNVSTPFISVKGTTVSVRVADTPEKREQGLSGTSPLLPNTGMLFIFDTPGTYGFWMKDMNYSLDMLWIGSDKIISHITENATPESYPEVFTPETPVLYVLEVPAGFAKEHSISVGDVVGLHL